MWVLCVSDLHTAYDCRWLGWGIVSTSPNSTPGVSNAILVSFNVKPFRTSFPNHIFIMLIMILCLLCLLCLCFAYVLPYALPYVICHMSYIINNVLVSGLEGTG
jgi:hypothetical protein